MRLMRFAAGLAVGYVLGSRAGRASYEQIVAAVRRARSDPGAAESQQATKDSISADTDTLTSNRAEQARDDEPTAPVGEAVPAVNTVPPRPPRKRTKSTLTAPSVALDDPLVIDVE